MHIVMLGTYFIYLHRVEVLLWKCVHFQSTCPWVFCGDMLQVWVRFDILPLPEVFVKCYNFMNCLNLTVLTRMQHAHALVTEDFNVPIGLISHNNIKHT